MPRVRKPVDLVDATPGIVRGPVVSTTIAEAGWLDGTLQVRFVGGGVYEYDHVSAEWWWEFLAAESKGRFHVGVKRDPVAYPCRRVRVVDGCPFCGDPLQEAACVAQKCPGPS